MSDGESDYYDMLGVPRDATNLELEEAYYRRRAEYPDDPNSEQAQFLQAAYDVLRDPSRRQLYDELIADADTRPLRLEFLASPKYLPVLDEPQVCYLLIKLMAANNSARPSLPLNLSLVIDCSTSMRGNRLSLVKTAARQVFELLAPDDILSIVGFSDRAELVLAAGCVAKRGELEESLGKLTAAGGTEILQGLECGLHEINKADLQEYTSHLVLLTDGQTYGDADACLDLAQQAANRGIGISAFGIGSDWNDTFLDALVAPSGGHSDFVDKPPQLAKFLSQRLQGLDDVRAKNVRLQANWPDQVEVIDAFKLAPFAQPLIEETGCYILGDVAGRFPQTTLLVFKVAPLPIPVRIRIPIHISAEIPGHSAQSIQDQFQLLVLLDAPDEMPSSELVSAVRLLNLYRINEKVTDEASRGNEQGAIQHLHYLTDRLANASATGLANEARQETRILSRTGALSAEGQKRLKYGTRFLMDQAFGQDDDSV